jgi:DNA sulfur modification protein DndC
MGEPYNGPSLDESPLFGAEDMALLREVCDGDELHFQLARELLDVERRHRSRARRAGLYRELEDSLRNNFYTSEEDAEQFAAARQRAKDTIAKGREETDRFLQLPLLDMSGEPASATRTAQ